MPERFPKRAPDAPFLRATLRRMDEVLAARRARLARLFPRLAGAMVVFPLMFAPAVFAETHPDPSKALSDDAPRCCPDLLITQKYQWRDAAFHRVLLDQQPLD